MGSQSVDPFFQASGLSFFGRTFFLFRNGHWPCVPCFFLDTSVWERVYESPLAFYNLLCIESRHIAGQTKRRKPPQGAATPPAARPARATGARRASGGVPRPDRPLMPRATVWRRRRASRGRQQRAALATTAFTRAQSVFLGKRLPATSKTIDRIGRRPLIYAIVRQRRRASSKASCRCFKGSYKEGAKLEEAFDPR